MRRTYLDSIRCATVLLVVLYHVVYQFNSVGCISNLDEPGIPQMDALLYFVYPWFMGLLFVVAGVSARHSLCKRSAREFLRERLRRVLLPSIAGMFLLGWICGWVTNQYTDLFLGAEVPPVVRYVIYCFCGIGPLWFLHELFLFSVLLVLLRRIDRNHRLDALAARVPVWGLVPLVIPAWLCSGLLVTPVIEVYRNGFYLLLFLLGYYLFSQERVIDALAKAAVWLVPLTAVFGVWYTLHWFGENYASQQCLNSISTNGYAWLGILAALGAGKRWGDRTSVLTRLHPYSFAVYVLHNPLLVLLGWLVCSRTTLPVAAVYLIVLLLEALVLPVMIVLVRRIPVVRTLLLGEWTK